MSRALDRSTPSRKGSGTGNGAPDLTIGRVYEVGLIALAPGAMDAHLSDTLFWSSLLGGFAVAFLVTTPVNKWMTGRGKGHAVVHAHH